MGNKLSPDVRKVSLASLSRFVVVVVTISDIVVIANCVVVIVLV